MIFTMDPGISARNATGVSLFHPTIKRLVAVSIIRPSESLDGLYRQRDVAERAVVWALTHSPMLLSAFVVEWPQVYPDEGIDPNVALLPLVGIIGAASGMLSPDISRTVYRPKAWKGTIDKKTCGARIFDRLDMRERGLLESVMPPGLRHNATDAVGLGLKFLGRMERSRAVHNEAP